MVDPKLVFTLTLSNRTICDGLPLARALRVELAWFESMYWSGVCAIVGYMSFVGKWKICLLGNFGWKLCCEKYRVEKFLWEFFFIKHLNLKTRTEERSRVFIDHVGHTPPAASVVRVNYQDLTKNMEKVTTKFQSQGTIKLVLI